MKEIIYFTLTLFLLMTHTGPIFARANTGKVVVSGHVSRIVALSLATESQEPLAHAVQVIPDGIDNLNLTLCGSGDVKLSIPVQIRSNTAYALSAAASAHGATLTELSITGLRPTGTFVTTDAIEGIEITEAFDAARELRPAQTAAQHPNSITGSAPVTLLSGPSVSRAGTLSSADNAVEITLHLSITPRSAENWTMSLHLSAAAR